MASFYAELHAGGVRIPLLSFRYEASQATDARGRVTTKVRKGLVYATCDVPAHGTLEVWAGLPHKRMPADVVLYDADGGQALETLSMAGAYCVEYQEWFVQGDKQSGSYTAAFTLADPDGWTLQRGGPGAYVTPAARAHGAPPAPAPALTEAQAAAASLETKKQRYKLRQKMLADSQAKLTRQMDQQMASLPRPSLVMPTEAGGPVPSEPLPRLDNLAPVQAAHDRFALNNLAVEHARLADDTYFTDAVRDANGKLNAVHFLAHNPDGTFLLSNPPEGWQVNQVFKDENSGFMAVLYKSTYTDTPLNVLAFRGTDADTNFMNDLKADVITDGLQGTGMYTSAFEQTKNTIRTVQDLLKDEPFTIAGHSLGGAEASLGGLLTGNNTYTFNAAGLHVNTIARAGIDPAVVVEREQHIQAFFADNDPLSFYQDRSTATKQALKVITDLPLLLTPLPNPLDPILQDPHTLPQAVGVRHLIPSGNTDWYKGADMGGHSVQPMVNVLEEQKSADFAALQRYLAKPD